MSSSYRLRNWSEYEHALEQRGSLTLLMPENTLRAWSAAAGAAGSRERQRSGRRRSRGRPRTYSDAAITSLLRLQMLFHLGLRETVGLARSLFALLKLDIRVPDHTTLARRRARLQLGLPVSPRTHPMHLVVDSTGLALRSEGSWQWHRTGERGRYTWKCHYRRIHLGVDEATGELRALGVSSMNVSDGAMFPALLAAVRAPLTQVTADGNYDEWQCYDAVAARPEHPRAVFPPPRFGKRRHHPRIRQHGNSRAPPLARDEHIRRIRRVGRTRWKEECGYHRRSRAETLISRDKRLFGDRLTSHSFDSQCTEVFLRGALLNQFLWLGRPDSYRAA